MCTNELGCNERRGTTMHYLNFIADPLNKKLMQGRWHTLIGMNPITSKYKAKVTLHLGNAESFVVLLPTVNSIEATPLAPIGSPPPTPLTIMCCLDEFFVRPTELLVE